MSKNPLGKLSQRAQRNSGAPDTAPVTVSQAGAATAKPAIRSVKAGEGGDVVHGKRRRGSSEVVSMTVRLRREDWAKLGELRLTEGKSGQEVFFEGLSAVFARYGFPPPQSP